MPETAAGLFAAVADGERDHLARPPAQGDPQPTFLAFVQHKGPQFVQFQDVTGLGRKHRLFELRNGPQNRTEPVRHRLTGDLKNALQTVQTGPLAIGFQNQGLELRGPRAFRHQRAMSATGMTVILGTSTFIRAILDDIQASASTTGISNGFLNHGISIRHHLLCNHYPD
jgi:hypothetical protein